MGTSPVKVEIVIEKPDEKLFEADEKNGSRSGSMFPLVEPFAEIMTPDYVQKDTRLLRLGQAQLVLFCCSGVIILLDFCMPSWSEVDESGSIKNYNSLAYRDAITGGAQIQPIWSHFADEAWPSMILAMASVTVAIMAICYALSHRPWRAFVYLTAHILMTCVLQALAHFQWRSFLTVWDMLFLIAIDLSYFLIWYFDCETPEVDLSAPEPPRDTRGSPRPFSESEENMWELARVDSLTSDILKAQNLV